ncbi:ATP-binding cassette domain-containing protein [Hafnia alvei]|uniref:ATP-binding cassette domain-containing protein n=1 Tax=Hafnia alvei TaxID=569 RepID=UPI000B63FAB3|nr:ATP-binding cassette domain-containing protein [Hafnia alvei]MBI0275755.1 ATP-binding cassette domain-containing protein [Hafnia alvei]PNK97960.1 energy-coupling factor ABC transporter ATP-binding protein [Hafnia alvei]
MSTSGLVTQHLSFQYQDGETVLHDLSLDFNRGQVTGLLGANGCGKSTLFMNLLGILQPQQGYVMWQGEKLSYDKRSLRALRQQVAMVFQEPDQQIFYTDIDSDIAFSLRNLGVDEDTIRHRTEQALTLVDALGFRHKPVQYLSHGQKKRVAIAGALVMNADYLLLDEPTAGLDPSGRQQMIHIIQKIVAQGKRVVISSHDIDLIYEVCDYLYVLAQGKLLSEGRENEVFLQREMLQRAGLVQPWLVKMHQQLGLPLFKTEHELFAFKPEFMPEQVK